MQSLDKRFLGVLCNILVTFLHILNYFKIKIGREISLQTVLLCLCNLSVYDWYYEFVYPIEHFGAKQINE